MSNPACVLVVDDSPTQLLQMRMILEAGGYQTRVAGDGQEALDAIAQTLPDLVVTDLQMPGLNGLQLVNEIKQRHASLPVILTTAVGSEEIATQALRIGAASYVPKSELAEVLCDTVKQVFDVATAKSTGAVTSLITKSELHFRIGNSEELVPALIARMEQMVSELGFCDEMQWMQIAMALDEAIINAIYHGNLDVSTDLRQEGDGDAFLEMVKLRKTQTPYRDRQVDIRAIAQPQRIDFVISDQGQGFDRSVLPDPTDPANLERAGGRGLLLIHSFMDEVLHNDVGNQITMVKYRPQPGADVDEDPGQDEDFLRSP